MSEKVKIERVRFAEVVVSEVTTWTFVEVYDEDGVVGLAELTCGGNTAEAVRLTGEFVGRLKGREIASESDVEGMLGFAVADMQGNMALATAMSGLRSAVSELSARKRGISLTEELGATPQESILLYANINRHLLTRDRSPASFGRVAEYAVSQGFGIVKCAPFDGVGPPSTREKILDDARTGIERVAAVRAAVGPDVTVLVDCHSRFERHTAALVAEQLAKSNIGWFEEPVEPTEDAEGLAEIAGEVSMITAGGESGYGREFFGAVVECGALNVVMPDVKHCGGLAEAMASGLAAMAAGGDVSLHSPTGPVSLIGGGHATAAMPGAIHLEHAVYETDWRAEVVLPYERVESGRLWMPDGVGLGAVLNSEIVERYGRYWNGD
ncbi:MAG: mandelate racemase/muconate lactonizing enzyme family protein [Chloroflexota bacterium]|nr:mandelate racemase/muconate lactonizing enzyme family protein [Chloroflexota bacterium]